MRPLTFGEQVLEGGEFGRFLGVVGQADRHQVARGEVILQPFARLLLRQVEHVLVIGDDVEIVVGDTSALGQQHRLRIERLHGGEGRIAATRHRLGGADVVLGVGVGDRNVVLLLEIRVCDVGLDLTLAQVPPTIEMANPSSAAGSGTPISANRSDGSRACRGEKVTTR